MPLKPGTSRKVIQANIREMIRSYKRTGKIGHVKPRNMRHALKIAAAAAYALARKSAEKRGRGFWRKWLRRRRRRR